MVGRHIFSAYIVNTGNSDTDRAAATGGEVIEDIVIDSRGDFVEIICYELWDFFPADDKNRLDCIGTISVVI